MLERFRRPFGYLLIPLSLVALALAVEMIIRQAAIGNVSRSIDDRLEELVTYGDVRAAFFGRNLRITDVRIHHPSSRDEIMHVANAFPHQLPGFQSPLAVQLQGVTINTDWYRRHGAGDAQLELLERLGLTDGSGEINLLSNYHQEGRHLELDMTYVSSQGDQVHLKLEADDVDRDDIIGLLSGDMPEIVPTMSRTSYVGSVENAVHKAAEALHVTPNSFVQTLLFPLPASAIDKWHELLKEAGAQTIAPIEIAPFGSSLYLSKLSFGKAGEEHLVLQGIRLTKANVKDLLNATVPSYGRVDVGEIRFDPTALDQSWAKRLRLLGIKKVVGRGVLEFAYDSELGVIIVNEAGLDVDGAFVAAVRASLRDVASITGGSLIEALSRAEILGASVRYVDTGLTDKVLNSLARTSSLERNALIEQIQGEIQLRQDLEDAAAAGPAIATFLSNPSSLQLFMLPSKPVPLMGMPFIIRIALDDPARIARGLGMWISVNDEPVAWPITDRHIPD